MGWILFILFFLFKLQREIFLTEVQRNEDSIIGGPCLAEMKSHRQMLMEDYSISPELVSKCGNDITNNCKHLNKKGNNPGEVIHCLMNMAMNRKLKEEQCETALQDLLQKADVASDWQVDPILKKACQEVVTSACHDQGRLSPIKFCRISLK